ncbi:MAG: hypothetical protein ACPGLV_07300 [Bacteroidia bacterium]
MIRFQRIFLIALLLITCATTTSQAQLPPVNQYKYSIGFDIARPLISIGLNQMEFEAYGMVHLNKYWAGSIQIGFENLPYRFIEKNIWGLSNSSYVSFNLNYKIIPRFWISAYFIASQTNEQYTTVLNGPNFQTVTRSIDNNFNSYGIGNRIYFYENLTERIEAILYFDGAIMFDQENKVNSSNASPGYLLGASRAIYSGAGVNIGYRIFKLPTSHN